MKKIDLHIHTVSTISDRAFSFSLDTFQRYVHDAKLDAVAVTNHDVFDSAQFRQIQKALGIVVFPGIEVNVEKATFSSFPVPMISRTLIEKLFLGSFDDVSGLLVSIRQDH